MPLHRNDDPQRLLPQETFKGFARVFDLAIPEQLDDYNGILNTIAKGVGVFCSEVVTFHEGRYIVYLRWMERFYATVEQVQQGVTRDEKNGQIHFRE